MFGGLLGILISYTLIHMIELTLMSVMLIFVYSFSGFVFGIIFYLLFPLVFKKFHIKISKTYTKVTKIPTFEIIVMILGLVIGLFIGVFGVFTYIKYKFSYCRKSFKCDNNYICIYNFRFFGS